MLEINGQTKDKKILIEQGRTEKSVSEHNSSKLLLNHNAYN